MTKLTNMQSKVFAYLLLGESNEDIAFRLGLVEQTVKNHIALIMKATGIYSRTRLISYFFRDKLKIQDFVLEKYVKDV